MATMLFHMSDPGILGLVLSLLRQVKQYIEAGKIAVPFNDGARLLRLYGIQLLDGVQKITKQTLLVFTKGDPGDLRFQSARLLVDIGK